MVMSFRIHLHMITCEILLLHMVDLLCRRSTADDRFTIQYKQYCASRKNFAIYIYNKNVYMQLAHFSLCVFFLARLFWYRCCDRHSVGAISIIEISYYDDIWLETKAHTKQKKDAADMLIQYNHTVNWTCS